VPNNTFAAIDVGSNEVSMKIFEVSKKYGVKELDHVRHTIELGSETYTNGKISHSVVNELCQVLQGFTKKMKEYQVEDYTACATSALREALNNLLILDQIKLASKLKVSILSNSEQRFLLYKAVALKEPCFNQIIEHGTAIVDVGAGSIQISLFNKGSLITTQNIKLGSLRIREILSTMENQTTNFNNLLEEYITNDLQTFKDFFLSDINLRNIIAVGDNLNELLRFRKYIEEMNSQKCNTETKGSMDRDAFYSLYAKLLSMNLNQISNSLQISKEQASLLVPTAMIYYKIFEETKATTMWSPCVSLTDGLVVDYAQKKQKVKLTHDFTLDILNAARNIARRYHCNQSHMKNVEYLALTLFDSLTKLHGLNNRDRLLLQIAVILHNCGEYINMNAGALNSYQIILSTEIIGLSHTERELIAYLVRFNIGNYPKYEELNNKFNKDTYIKISKLSAILRIANAMDKSHKQKFSNISVTYRDNQLTIIGITLEDTTLERGLFEKKAEFFEEVYGIRPQLKQRRS
jgi:exopolyphosphatase / guanosine-5'-triphosphate,3'-diphosphate pyrophosphatase